MAFWGQLMQEKAQKPIPLYDPRIPQLSAPCSVTVAT